LDLVVIEEPATRGVNWDGKQADREKTRLERALGLPPVPTDITVRSTQQYVDARAVFGGVEWLVDTEGIVLFAAPLVRRIVPRLTNERVRNGLIVAWLEAALQSLARGQTAPIPMQASPIFVAHVGAQGIVLRPSSAPAQPPDYYWHRSIQQSLAAACVFHQVVAAKHDNMVTVAVKLRSHSALLHERFTYYASAPPTSTTAYTAAQEVIAWVRDHGGMDAILGPISVRLQEFFAKLTASERGKWSAARNAIAEAGCASASTVAGA
jgi:hypothetical protein